MNRFDVYKSNSGSGYLLDVQSDILSGLNTRVVVPLTLSSESLQHAGRLNPTFEIDGETIIMATQFIAAVPESELKHRVINLNHNHHDTTEALDMLLTGF
jgi:toxin CcdB